MKAENCAEAISSSSFGVRDWAPARSLEIDPETFRTHFNREPFLFRHHVSDHSLFKLPRLAELTRTLPPSIVEYNAGNIPVSLPVDEIEPLSERIEPGMCERQGAIFVTSPSSITPYHMDHEINFLLQIRGTKTISVFSASDREVLSEQELEEHFSGPAIHRNMAFVERYQERARVFELREGYGIHIPTTDPHWVKNGDCVSVSFSASFKTRASLRRGAIYSLNGQLRKTGLDPAPYGQSALRDSIKYQAFRMLNRVRRRTKG